MWSGILQNMLLYSLARHAPTDLWLQTFVRVHCATSTTIHSYIGTYPAHDMIRPARRHTANQQLNAC